MIIDHGTTLSKTQADVRAAGSYLSQNSINLGHARGGQLGAPLDLVFRVGTAFAGGTSVEFQEVCADDAALTSNLVVLSTTGAIAEAALTANTIVSQRPATRDIPKKYYGIRAVGVGVHTGGDFDAMLVERAPMSKPF